MIEIYPYSLTPREVTYFGGRPRDIRSPIRSAVTLTLHSCGSQLRWIYDPGWGEEWMTSGHYSSLQCGLYQHAFTGQEPHWRLSAGMETSSSSDSTCLIDVPFDLERDDWQSLVLVTPDFTDPLIAAYADQYRLAATLIDALFTHARSCVKEVGHVHEA